MMAITLERFSEAPMRNRRRRAKRKWQKFTAGLVKACMSHHGVGFEVEKWKDVSRIYRRTMELAFGRKSRRAEVSKVQRW